MTHEAALAALGDAERKRATGLQARAAFRGIEVRAFTAGSGSVEFMVLRGPHSTFCPSIDQLESKLRLAGVDVDDGDGLKEREARRVSVNYSLVPILESLGKLGDSDSARRANVVRDQLDTERDYLRGPGGAGSS